MRWAGGRRAAQVRGKLGVGVTSKDVILHVIGVIGTAGGTGHVIEFCGDAIRALSMEARMSVCNMAIEAGARAGTSPLPPPAYTHTVHGAGPTAAALWRSEVGQE